MGIWDIYDGDIEMTKTNKSWIIGIRGYNYVHYGIIVFIMAMNGGYN